MEYFFNVTDLIFVNTTDHNFFLCLGLGLFFLSRALGFLCGHRGFLIRPFLWELDYIFRIFIGILIRMFWFVDFIVWNILRFLSIAKYYFEGYAIIHCWLAELAEKFNHFHWLPYVKYLLWWTTIAIDNLMQSQIIFFFLEAIWFYLLIWYIRWRTDYIFTTIRT